MSKLKSIGDIYLSSSHFNCKKSNTMGRISIDNDSLQIKENIKSDKGRLSERGEKALDKIREKLNHVFKDYRIQFKWDKYCGCTLCPCSPGFRIRINKEVRSAAKYRFSIYLDEKGNYFFKEPEYSFEVGSDNLNKLKQLFV